MGLIYSQAQFNINIEVGVENEKQLNISNEKLRLPITVAHRIIVNYLNFKYPPILSYVEFHGFFQNCAHSDQLELVYVLWKIYCLQSICYIHEVLVCLVLLCDGDWSERLGLLFELFKSQGTNEVTYDDILMMVQVVAVSLYKLWMTEEGWKQSELNSLAEGISDGAYAKLGKEMEDGMTKIEFLNWTQERFKASRSIATPESLVNILTSQYE